MNTLTVMKYQFKCKIVFFHHEVRNHNKFAMYLYKSTILPCIKYCCHNWVGFSSCYLKLLDKLQKWICRTVGPSLAPSLEPLAHHRNVASLSLFYRYYFGRCPSGLSHFLILEVGPFLEVTMMSMSTVSFLAQNLHRILCLQNAFL